MIHFIAVYPDSENAGNAVAALKEKGFIDDLSVIAKDVNSPGTTSHQVKEKVTDGALTGAAAGSAIAAIATLLVGATSITIPGVGLVTVGPLAAAVSSAAAGGLIGALVDMGIPDEKAKEFQEFARSGDVLIAASVPEDRWLETREILNAHIPREVSEFTK